MAGGTYVPGMPGRCEGRMMGWPEGGGWVGVVTAAGGAGVGAGGVAVAAGVVLAGLVARDVRDLPREFAAPDA
jgi:hypothetical protein